MRHVFILCLFGCLNCTISCPTLYFVTLLLHFCGALLNLLFSCFRIEKKEASHCSNVSSTSGESPVAHVCTHSSLVSTEKKKRKERQ